MLGASARDLKDIFGSGKAGDILNGVGSAIESATATSNFDVKDLVGTWNYKSPGVIFKGDNALGNLTGAAASATLENKLAPYYDKAGLAAMTMTVDNDLNFTIQIKHGTLTGTVSKDDDGNMYFNFKAFGKYNFGKVGCKAAKSGSTLTLAFDAKRLIDVLKKVSSMAKDSTFKTVSDLLSKYEGIYIGVKIQRK